LYDGWNIAPEGKVYRPEVHVLTIPPDLEWNAYALDFFMAKD
jgi:hypothetical protein